MAGLSWLNSDNSTAKGEWKNNPTYRSTWQIYQSCVITIGLCVWQAVHMNIPPPSERPYKQTLRRVGFVILALIAPEVVALNAWAQLREAKHLCDRVNRALSPKKAQTSDDQQFTTIEPQKQPSHYAILTKVFTKRQKNSKKQSSRTNQRSRGIISTMDAYDGLLRT
ncbi:hypothetical protein KC338_g1569 [Hortaea werneckii]|nr:hypothetical protein KC323_g2955 [Hortaea werneckii]KAI6873454.1 hypothetical protein KC338_g1569 [Hortaea werneckii]